MGRGVLEEKPPVSDKTMEKQTKKIKKSANKCNFVLFTYLLGIRYAVSRFGLCQEGRLLFRKRSLSADFCSLASVRRFSARI